MGWLNSRKWWAAALVLMVGLPLIVGCSSDDKDPPPPTQPDPTPVTGTITGTVQLQAGVTGDLRNARVAIYADFNDWNNDRVLRQVTAQGTEFSVSFTFTNVTPGSYYLDVWKDTNNSGDIDAGDFFAVHGTTVWPGPTLAPLSVQAGQVTNSNMFAIRIQ